MAIKENGPTAPNPAEASATASHEKMRQQVPQNPAPGASGAVNTFDEFAMMFAPARGFPPGIEKYCETITEGLKAADELSKNSFRPTNIKVYRLSTPSHTGLICVCNSICVVLIFQEASRVTSFNNNEFYPAYNSINHGLRSTISSVVKEAVFPIQVILVNPVDYLLAPTMARFIYAELVGYGNENLKHFSLKNMIRGASSRPEEYDQGRNGYTLFIDGSASSVTQQLTNAFPLKAPPPYDIGVVVGRRLTKGGYNTYNNEAAMDEPIATVTMKVDLVLADNRLAGVNQNQPSYIYYPVLRITGVHSQFRHPGIDLFALASAVEHVTATGKWKEPFLSIGPNRPNIGNTIMTADKLYAVTSEDEARAILARDVAPVPAVAVDVTRGYPTRPVFSELLNGDTGRSVILNIVSNFFSVNNAPEVFSRMPSLAATCLTEIAGLIGDINSETDNSKVMDSRSCGFFDIINRRGAPPNFDEFNKLRLTFLNFPNDLSERPRYLNSLFGGNFTSIYHNEIVVLKPDFINLLLTLIAGHKLNFNVSSKLVGTQSIAGLMQAYQNLGAYCPVQQPHHQQNPQNWLGTGIFSL